jgi:hypothetical protein
MSQHSGTVVTDGLSSQRKSGREHGQFRKGLSGNPQGRRPGRKNMSTWLQEVLSERVPVKDPRSGKRVRLSKAEIVIKRLSHQALKGDPSALDVMLAMAESLGALHSSEAADAPKVILPETCKTIEEWEEKHGPAMSLAWQQSPEWQAEYYDSSPMRKKEMIDEIRDQ